MQSQLTVKPNRSQPKPRQSHSKFTCQTCLEHTRIQTLGTVGNELFGILGALLGDLGHSGHWEAFAFQGTFSKLLDKANKGGLNDKNRVSGDTRVYL